MKKEIKDKILSSAKLIDLIPGLKKQGKDFYTKCPGCGKEGKGKGLSVSAAKNIGKCFSCDYTISSPVDYLMKTMNLKYPDALKKLADQYGIIDEPISARIARLDYEVKHKNNNKIKKVKSFRDIQLEQSGLTLDDVTAEIREDDQRTTRKHSVFRSGTRDQWGKFVEGVGDDMLIEYYDLDGKPVTYRDKGGKYPPLIRVRWSNPGVHLSKEGAPMKYQSPAGSGSHVYIPQYIRTHYQTGRQIDTLFIQEGEKKAEKSCKHGIPSIGIMGIQNFGNKGVFPPEVQLVIQRCDVKNVVFLLDSDYNNLSQNLKSGDAADQRPKSFFFAVKNYKDYMKTLINLNISVEIYFGHIKQNDKDDKGIDDLLTNTLVGNEDLLKKDVEYAMNRKDGIGEYLRILKITMMNDIDLSKYWHLDDPDKFAKEHYDKLKEIRIFKINKIMRRFDESGNLEFEDPLTTNEKYWIVDYGKDGKATYSFNYVNCFEFLKNRGFSRIRMKSGAFDFCQTEGHIIKRCDALEIRDFVTSFTKALKDNAEILNMLYRGGPQYLGPDKLSNLDYAFPVFDRATNSSQRLYFKNVYWDISADGIKEYPLTNMPHYIWADQVIDFDAKLSEDYFLDAEALCSSGGEFDKNFRLKISDKAENCDFLQFLMNASNFYWKETDPEMDEDQAWEYSRHILNKLTAIGYLLHDYKNDSELKAVIAVDGKLSEVGSSNGRSGKSLMGVALEQVIPQVYINAKRSKMTEDPFLFGEVTEKTRNVFIDDARAHFDFEFFFPTITAKMKVNPKGAAPFTLEKNDSPKLLFTTNHAIDGEGSSFADRQAYVVFSDFYNDQHKPVHDFGRNFFSEWEKDQWNLFYNLIAASLKLYFKAIRYGWAGANQGIVPAPCQNIEKRKLRQMMNEEFLMWAELYFCEEINPDAPFDVMLNKRLKRQEVWESLCQSYSGADKFIRQTGFKKRLKMYCLYKGYHFNPNRPNQDGIDFGSFTRNNPDKPFVGTDDKVAGVEYITVATQNYIS